MGTTPFKKVVAQDVADALGVALSTVNKALTGKPGVSEKRRQEIKGKAREMGYKADGVAQILARNPITIGAIMQQPTKDPADGYQVGIIAGMQEEFAHLQKYKVKPEFFFVNNAHSNFSDSAEMRAWIKEHQIEALVINLTSGTYKQELLDDAARMKLPLFIAGGGIVAPADCISQIEVDAELSGRLVADFFAFKYGKEARVGLFIDSMKWENQRTRIYACTKALREYGVECIHAVEFHNIVSFLQSEVERLVIREHVNCIYMAIGYTDALCEFLEKKGWQDQVTVIGTDTFERIRERFASGSLDALFRQNEKEIGRRTVRMAYDYLVNTRTFGMEDWRAPKHVYVEPMFCLKSCFDR